MQNIKNAVEKHRNLILEAERYMAKSRNRIIYSEDGATVKI